MAINSDALHAILTTILGAFKSPSHALGGPDAPDSWTAYGHLPFKLCGLIGQIGDLPGGVENLSLNDQGKLKATLANELQLQEERAEVVLHAQLKFMQTVAEAAVDAVTEVAESLQDAIDAQSEGESDPGDNVADDVDQGEDDTDEEDEPEIVTPTENIVPDELGKPDPDRDPSPPSAGETVDFPGKNAPEVGELEAPVPENAPAADLPVEPTVESDPTETAPEADAPASDSAEPSDGSAEAPAAPEPAAPEASTDAPAADPAAPPAEGEAPATDESASKDKEKPVDPASPVG